MTHSQKRAERLSDARKKGTHTKEEWQEMKSFFNNTCVRCNGKSGLVNVEKDHIKPIYQGGSDSIRNLQPVCARCNSSKGSEIIDHRITYCKNNSLVMPEKWL